MIARVATPALILCLAGASGCGRPSSEAGAPPPAGRVGVEAPRRASGAPTVSAAPDPAELATRLAASEIRAALPPLPPVSFAPPRPPEVVQAAYEFAAVHPEVLKFIPCFCGCEQSGHQHNESCFVSRRAADGRVLEWDDHGLG